MTNKEMLENEIKKREKNSKWFKIILAISIILGIASITSININIAVYIFGISIITIIISIIFIKKYDKEIESIENDIHNIEIIKIGTEQATKDNTQKSYHKNQYSIKTSLLTEYESKFYTTLKENFSNEYEIHPQVPLSSIIEKQKTFENQYQNELYRVIDFGIFSKDSFKPLLLIEINDKTHKTKERKERDAKVKEICDIANIEIITFWTDYSNTEEYVVNRIKKYINS